MKLLLQLIPVIQSLWKRASLLPTARLHVPGAPGMHDPICRSMPMARVAGRVGESQHPLISGPPASAGRDAGPLAPHSGTTLRSFENHQQCNDLRCPLRPGRCKGEPLLSAHDETSVFSPLAEETNFVCAQARGICPLSHFCLYHLNIQYSPYASVLVKDAEDLLMLRV